MHNKFRAANAFGPPMLLRPFRLTVAAPPPPTALPLELATPVTVVALPVANEAMLP